MVCQKATGGGEYENLIARAEGIDNVTFLPRVPFQEIDSLFRRSKLLVNTSTAEGFPNTFIQACKAAVPILSVSVNPDNFLTRHECGICCQGDTRRMSKQVAALLNSSVARDMGQNGRRYVEAHHDVARIVECYKRYFLQHTSDLRAVASVSKRAGGPR